jgi:hypothetical protein
MTMPHGYEHPSPEDVLEHEAPERDIDPIPVVVNGPVETRTLGVVGWSGNSYSVGATNPTQIVQAQPMRSALIIEVTTQDVWIGRTEAEARAKSGFRLGASAAKQMVMTHREELWALADTGTAVVSAYQEFWSN